MEKLVNFFFTKSDGASADYLLKVYKDDVYVVGRNEILKSSDEFTTYEVISDTLHFKNISIVNDSLMYSSGGSNFIDINKIYKSIDGGYNWELFSLIDSSCFPLAKQQR